MYSTPDRRKEGMLEAREQRAKIISTIAEAQKKLDESYGTTDTFLTEKSKEQRI